MKPKGRGWLRVPSGGFDPGFGCGWYNKTASPQCCMCPHDLGDGSCECGVCDSIALDWTPSHRRNEEQFFGYVPIEDVADVLNNMTITQSG
jgi:hypothetical protein